MVFLSAGGLGIFPSFFEKESQTFVQQFEPRKEKSQTVAVVTAFHFFQRLEASVEESLEIGSLPQTDPTLRAIQIVGGDDVRATGTEADFHILSLGHDPRDSNPQIYILVSQAFASEANPEVSIESYSFYFVA